MESDASAEPQRPVTPDLAAAAATYRCVCGATFQLDALQGGTCSQCGRHFTAQVLQTAGAETLDIEAVSSDPSTVAPPSGDDAPDPRLGETLDHFRIVRRLGQGGMGTVYQALDESLQRYVALKVIRAGESGGTDSAQLQSLVQEARAQARVNHPNVVTIYYVGRDERSPFFAMELVKGPTLAERLRHGPLPFADAIDIGLQLVDVLEHAANFDIVHGDIKPSNVLEAERRIFKLSDFGLARRLSEQKGDAPGVIGTPNYLSPEAALGDPLDIRSDMYSLGVTLFEMTFGRLPYASSGVTLAEKLRAHNEAPVEFPFPWPSDVPEGYRHVLQRLLAKRPEDRYDNYDELRRDLVRLRPVSLPRAGRLPRALAWMIDLVLAAGMQAVLMAPIAAAGGAALLERYPGIRLFSAVVSTIVPLLAMYLQAQWGTTPGKKLFQIRIVDRHGVRPPRAKLAARSVVQFFPLWAGPFGSLFAVFRLEAIAAVILILAFLALLIDAAVAALGPRGRSLHDILFGTQVVLDAGSGTDWRPPS